MGVARENEANVLPHDCFHGRPGLVGHHYGGDALPPPRESSVEIHAVVAITERHGGEKGEEEGEG